MKKLIELLQMIDNEKHRSAWNKGVKIYAYELIEQMIENNGENYEFYSSPADKKSLLNGAKNWHEYSYGGAALAYDEEIAERLCSPSTLKKYDNGNKNPNSRETWLDWQACALFQAENMILRIAKS